VVEVLVKYVALISLAGAGISFIAGLWKYLDQRNREERNRRFETYHDLMRTVSAFEKDGNACPLTQQMAAIYELQHFRDYAYASTPILKHLRDFYGKKAAPPELIEALDATLSALRSS